MSSTTPTADPGGLNYHVVTADDLARGDRERVRIMRGEVSARQTGWVPIGGVPVGTAIPVIACRRVRTGYGEMFAFDCPHCWTYGRAYGVDDQVVCSPYVNYRRRPKRAQPVRHVHGAIPGHRVAHCINDSSPFTKTGYILRAA